MKKLLCILFTLFFCLTFAVAQFPDDIDLQNWFEANSEIVKNDYSKLKPGMNFSRLEINGSLYTDHSNVNQIVEIKEEKDYTGNRYVTKMVFAKFVELVSLDENGNNVYHKNVLYETVYLYDKDKVNIILCGTFSYFGFEDDDKLFKEDFLGREILIPVEGTVYVGSYNYIRLNITNCRIEFNYNGNSIWPYISGSD